MINLGNLLYTFATGRQAQIVRANVTASGLFRAQTWPFALPFDAGPFGFDPRVKKEFKEHAQPFTLLLCRASG